MNRPEIDELRNTESDLRYWEKKWLE